MSKKIDASKIDLQIEDVRFVDHAIIIDWSANIGWGEYVVSTENRKFLCDSECMDRGEDKAFLEELLRKMTAYISENAEIVG